MMELENHVVYGPVRSRRFGWDIGINLLPSDRKLCTFDCIYCQYGFSGHGVQGNAPFPPVAEVIRFWEQKLRECQDQGLRIRHTTLAGNGEPTMHPDFPELIAELVRFRDENFPYVRLALLSNGYRLHVPEIRHAINLLDEPVLKLDAGDPSRIQQINQPKVRLDMKVYVESLKKCHRVILQTMFLRGWNDGREALSAWMNILMEVKPESVQIYSLDRNPALPELEPLSSEELSAIAREASMRTGVPVHAFL